MPRYDYQCNSCGEMREYEHSMNDRPRFCSECYAPGENLERKFNPGSAPAIHGGGSAGSGRFISEGKLINLLTGEVMDGGSTKETRRDMPCGNHSAIQENFVDKRTGKEFPAQIIRIDRKKD